MSSEDYEIFKELKRKRQAEGGDRRVQAEDDFDLARDMARAKGWTLKKCSCLHFQLMPVGRRILINLYPGNQRVYQDPNKKRQFLKLPMPWTLQDVVKAATEVVSITG